MKILITGASGFIGTHITSYATDQQHQVVAGIRQSSSIAHLADSTATVRTLSYHSETLLEEELKEIRDEFGSFDSIIHNVGLTKSFTPQRLFEVNQDLPVRLAGIVQKLGLLTAGGKFVFVSSLAARGPYGIFKPVTNYGLSKLQAEEQLRQMGLPLVIVRPTAVYGPGDAAFLKLFRVIKFNFAPLLAKPTQQLTFIFARDLARMLVDYAPQQPENTIIAATDGLTYSPKSLYGSIGAAIGKNPVTIRIPGFVMLPVAHMNQLFSKMFNQQAVLTPEKMNELTADWTLSDTDFHPKEFIFTSLSDGLKQSAEHYRKNGLL